MFSFTFTLVFYTEHFLFHWNINVVTQAKFCWTLIITSRLENNRMKEDKSVLILINQTKA